VEARALVSLVGKGTGRFLLLVAAGIVAKLAADWLTNNVRAVRRATGGF
jgi:hypothetical protein